MPWRSRQLRLEALNYDPAAPPTPHRHQGRRGAERRRKCRCTVKPQSGATRTSKQAGRNPMKELESLDAAFVIDTFLLLLIGVGPKIALVPFLEATSDMSETTKRRVLRKMLTTAAVVSALLLILGGLLTRLLHFSPGALGVSSGLILFVIAVALVLGHPGASGGDHPVKGQDPM